MRLLVLALQHPGFALVQVLSPCQTFRPEQKNWKQMVHPVAEPAPTDPSQAAQLIQSDDGLALGVLYAQRLPVYQPRNRAETELAEIEAEFLR